MPKISNIIILCLLPLNLWAQDRQSAAVDELTKAYQREILFLSTYKNELQQKIKATQSSLGAKLQEGQKELKQLESQWIRLQTDNEVALQRVSDLESQFENKQENRDLLNTTLKQAGLDKSIKKDLEKEPLLNQLATLFEGAFQELNSSNKVEKNQGTFFSEDGEQKEGTILQLGQIARFAESGGRLAALFPSGGGSFRVWKWLSADQNSLISGQLPSEISLFLYDNPEKEFTQKVEKTLYSVLQSGGLIGWVIVVMGLFALAISFIRFYLLQNAKNRNDQDLEQVIARVKDNKIEEAQHLLLREENAVSRVLLRTLSFLKTEPNKVEDAISESIIKESQLIDRFGVVILVVASVAPLMGLLGTVTGMISTFDIITLYGTGNPKLLSGGISEALVTTMFGLIVAIPALLIGQFLNAKTESIKSDMEKWALAICNAFENRGSQE